ncbi:MAG: TadE family protein [Chloroflexota bacterium]
MLLKNVVERIRRCVQGQAGTGTVEFAIVAMVLVLLLLGTWDFGRLFNAWLVVTNAAREGARYGAIYGSERDIQESEVVSLVKQHTLDYLNGGFGTRGDIQPYSGDDVAVQFPSGRLLGEPVEVTVAVRVDVWPLVRDAFFGGSDTATIHGDAAMRM